MTAMLPVRPAAPEAFSTRSAWPATLIWLGVSVTATLLLFGRDAADMAAIWWDSSTFNHCLLIGPIIAWLVWIRLPRLKMVEPRPWTAALLVVAAGGFAWLLGEAGGLGLARHVGLIVMLQGQALVFVGPRAGKVLAFPVFYAAFLIPAGEEVVPQMQMVTAAITALLLDLSALPAHVDGIFITTPTGFFEVAEACAGVKFLIAMVAFAVLVGHLCFDGWKRRAAFLFVSLLVAILANGVRAWGTIFIAHHFDPGFAASFDHVFYGFFFFALVIAITLGMSWRFFDRPSDHLPALPAPDSRTGRPAPLVAGLAFLLLLAPPSWTAIAAHSGTEEVNADFALPDLPGWTKAPPPADWQPFFAGADLIRGARYRDGEGQPVDLFVIVFADQAEGRELVGFDQGAASSRSGWTWSSPAPTPPNGRGERIISHGLVREVVSFYRVGDVVTGSGARVKWETMRARLLGGPQRAVAVMASSPVAAIDVSQRARIDALLRALGPLDRLADRAAGLK